MTVVQTPFRIAVISENANANWVWIRDLLGSDYRAHDRLLSWHGYSTAPQHFTTDVIGRTIAPRLRSYGQWQAARILLRAHQADPFDLIISHGPWVSAWTEHILSKNKNDAFHLAYSFNFTDIPKGMRNQLMRKAFSSIDGFAVFTDAESQLYPKIFNIPAAQFIRAPWGVSPPLSYDVPREISEPYFAALGGEARDYSLLCETARACPDTKFVAIARAHSFAELTPPKNLEVYTNLPFERAWGFIQHCEAALLPLRSRETPCGLVTLVGAMHLGKAQIATNAAGTGEHLQDDETAILVPPGDPAAMSAAVQRIIKDPGLGKRLGNAAKIAAAAHHSEAQTVQFLKDFLEQPAFART